MKDIIIVKQERGEDSTVKIFAETRDIFAGSQSFLRFESDQILTSQSDRCRKVAAAIETYCLERGYVYRSDNLKKYTTECRYSSQHYSRMLTHKIEKAVRKDSRYIAASAQTQEIAIALNDEYCREINLLKNLVFALEKKLDTELQKERDALRDLQVELVQEMDVPVQVNDFDRDRLFKPRYPLANIKQDRYAGRMRREELPPSDISEILEMAK